MPNPIVVSVPITQAPATLYITVDTYAAYTQKATIQPVSGGQPFVAQGSGEGVRIGFWTYQVQSTGIYQFNVMTQYNDGSGFKNSAGVSAGSFSTRSLNQTVVFSEDAVDNDDNDCFITFMWFQSGVAARMAAAPEAEVAS
ncbi:MAG TPA: hypothetical protein VE010_14670 [Thermoanaerobaculia bacterium]|nr:hypothetical protein [Thermoanaerobaculia bacterium]